MAVHDSMRLHTTSDRFFIEPTDTGTNELLIIDRVTKEITLEDNTDQIPVTALCQNICGLFGIIRLLAGPYLIVITKKTKVGDINGHAIWEVAETEVISYQRTLLHLTEAQVQDNKTYVQMLDTVLKQGGYYFSSTYDLTHSVHRLQNTSPDFLQIPLHERADQRFVWNGHVLREFTQQPELSQFCLPVLHGFVEVSRCNVDNKLFDYVLISRRSCFRAGTRYYIRGLDSEGHAANFVETEQIVEYEGNRAAFVQTRGSVPMFWSQRPNLKYKPTPKISSILNHFEGFQYHLNSQIFNYGKQVLINLIDHKGAENTLEQALSDIVKNSQNNNIRYEPFDFHHECRRMRWERLSILVDRVAEDQHQFGYSMTLRDGTVVCQQSGVFRTNCIDCLDRTNVVQSLLARRCLQHQFQKLGILEEGQLVEEQTSFESIFKNVWADNADACAVQYAGTGALKTDFTRTGKRTKLGLLKDGWNSTIRYFKNNFYDGFRQDSIDLLLGNYIVDENEGNTVPCPLRSERDWKFFSLLVIFIFGLAMCLLSILIPDEHWTEQAAYILFWGTACLVSLSLIYYYGTEFVDRPKLTQAKVKDD